MKRSSVAFGLLFTAASLYAQQAPPASQQVLSTVAPTAPQAKPTGQQAAPAPAPAAPKHALTRTQQAKQRTALEKELNDADKKWLNEDVAYIITDEERDSFLQLTNEDERESFIEAFWQRRNPDPDSTFNQYKEDHYERIAYANEHFAAGEPGWKTDRGRIYIMWGKPNEEDDHDAGGGYSRPATDGGGETSTFPFEDWTYNYLEGVGQNIKIEFVDTCMCGEFHYSTDPGEKDALAHVPGAGLSTEEAMGLVSKDDRFTRADGSTLPVDSITPESQNEFEVINQYAKIFAPPPIKYADLSEKVDHNLNYSLLPFQYTADYVKMTEDAVMVPITIQIPDNKMTFKETNGVEVGSVEIYGRISTITGKMVDQIDNVHVDLRIPDELLPNYADQTSRFWHAAYLKPGRYKVSLILKDVNASDKLGTRDFSIVVPDYKDDVLASSTVILADDIQKVPPKDVGTGQFIIGDVKVRPVMGGMGSPAQFKANESMGIYFQVYNLQVDKTTHKPNATINYEIDDLAKDAADPHHVVLNFTEDSSKIADASDEMTITKSLPLASLAPSTYRLKVTVTDKSSGQTISPETSFVILH